MSTIHQHLSSIDLKSRRNAGEYQELYRDLKSLAQESDNKREVDKNPRAGEVFLQETRDSVEVGLSYTRDQIYTGERLSLLQSEITPDGKSGQKISLRAEPTDPKGRYLRFERWEYEGTNISKDSHVSTVLVDTQKGTLFIQEH